MIRGLVIGKFYPPHRGHHYLIDTALAACDEVEVLVCDSPTYRIPAEKRASWLSAIHPHARVRIIPDIGKDDDSKAWAAHTLAFLGYAPDIVFTSEDYGTAYAAAMGCEHRLVDRVRAYVPVSGTKVRSDVLAHWQFLDPLVRQLYCRRICVLGAESTGTTTLAKALARHYQTYWVPEYGRYHTEAMLTAGTEIDWNSQDFDFIAAQQQAWEDALAGKSSGLLICDTNAFATRVWRRRYLGSYGETLEWSRHKAYDLYIVTYPDIPFEQDGTRDGSDRVRHEMHRWFTEELEKAGQPYLVVRGAHSVRLKQATKKIDALLGEKVCI
jgi:NadR type nicotinamide-nucleotide adenylyltransferase